ncbi:hypothetical protein [Streptomyces sp. NPDC055109]
MAVSYRLALVHVRAGGELPSSSGELVVQGEDLSAWVVVQRARWERLMPAQRFLLESIGVEAPADGKAAVGQCGGRKVMPQCSIPPILRQQTGGGFKDAFHFIYFDGAYRLSGFPTNLGR